MALTTPEQTRTIGGQPVQRREDVKEIRGYDMPRMAGRMWPIMLVMGVMLVSAGIGAGVYQASAVDDQLVYDQFATWIPGINFLGIAFLLSAITLVLATILGQLRDSGATVQRALGEEALMIRRPWSGWLFPPLMMMGLMTAIFGAVMSFVAASNLDNDAEFARDVAGWVGPVRFAGVLMIFSAIVLALATIVKAIRFQGDRIGEIAAERDADLGVGADGRR